MKICIVSESYPTGAGVGGFFFVEQLVNQFVAQGNDCTVIAPVNIMGKYLFSKPYGSYHEKKSLSCGKSIDVYRPRFYGRNIKIGGVSLNAWAPMVAFEFAINNISEKFDIIYCHFFRMAVIAFRYARKHDIPLFVATGESVIPRIKMPFKHFKIKDFADYLSGVICVSSKNLKEAIRLGYTTKEKCKIFPNGADLSLFKPLNRKQCRMKLELTDNDFAVICIGNFVERKGQNRIIKAVALLNNPNIKIILIGRGEGVLKSHSIIFKGFVQHQRVPEYLNAADVFVLPTRAEGCCNSIIEAMACGLPIISSNLDFNFDILNSNNAILINPDDIKSISEAIHFLYSNEQERSRLALESIATAKHLSIEERAKSIINYIRKQTGQSN
jgi:glycosyltransferase involved in cell wall biosynthesis